MKTVDITYRCGPQDADARPRPTDSKAALNRLNDGNRTFAALLEGFAEQAGGV
jgi:carbonic anhydrase